MQIYDSLPNFNEAKELLKNNIDDAKVSFDPYVIDPYTLKCMQASYSAEEFLEIKKLIAPYVSYIKPRQEMSLFVGFEHVHMPSVDFSLPSRATSRSAGYDFYLPQDIVVRSEEPVFVKLGVKVAIPDDMVLQLYIRSSLSKKMFLLNAVGIIDSDYYNNPDNMGEIGAMLQAWPGMEPIYLTRGDRVLQGILTRYSTIDIDIPRNLERAGGFGSSGK
jgi:dUTP pyrophosphatase